MGMFDEIITIQKDRFTCGEGHIPDTLWQTKSLDCTMSEYVLDSSRIYRKKRRATRTFEEGQLVLRWELTPQDNLTDYIEFYTHCHICSKKYRINGHKVLNFIEYGVYIKEGRVIDINPIRVKTSEENLQYIKESYPEDAVITEG